MLRFANALSRIASIPRGTDGACLNFARFGKLAIAAIAKGDSTRSTKPSRTALQRKATCIHHCANLSHIKLGAFHVRADDIFLHRFQRAREGLQLLRAADNAAPRIVDHHHRVGRHDDFIANHRDHGRHGRSHAVDTHDSGPESAEACLRWQSRLTRRHHRC